MDMNNTVVIGYPEFGNLTIVRNKLTGKEGYSGYYKYIGYVDRLNEELFEWLTFRNEFNYTLVPLNDSERSLDTMSEDWFIFHPYMRAFDTIELTHPHILSPYNCSQEMSRDESRDADLIESIYGFDTLTWTVSLITAMAIALLINAHFKLNGYMSKGPSSSGLWTVFSAILKNPSPKEINYNGRFLMAILSLFAFLVEVCYFENMIKSDQVSIYQPTVYRSLEDVVLDPESIVMIDAMMRQVLVDDPFNEFHQNILAKGTRIHGKDIQEVLLFPFIRPIEHKSILIYYHNPAPYFCAVRSTIAKNLRTLNTIISDQEYRGMHYRLENTCVYSEQIVGLRPKTRARPYSDRFTKKNIFKKYYKYTRRSFEMSLSRRTVATARETAAYKTNDITDCIQRPPKTWDRDIPDPTKLYFYRLSFLGLMIPLTMALIVLKYEQLYRSFDHPPLIIEGMSLLNIPTITDLELAPSSSTIPDSEPVPSTSKNSDQLFYVREKSDRGKTIVRIEAVEECIEEFDSE